MVTVFKKSALRRGLVLGLALSTALGISSPCMAVEGSVESPAFRGIDQWVRTVYTAKDGAPRGVEAMAQDARGFLWLGTSEGLFRFDGTLFERKFADRLPVGTINALYGADDGSLWVGGHYGAVSRIAADGALTTWGSPPLLPSTVMFMTQMPDGVLWVVSNSGVQSLSRGHWRRHGPDSDGAPRELIYQAFRDPHDRLWVVTALRAYRLDPGSAHFVQDTPEAAASAMVDRPGASWRPADIVNDEARDAYGALWIPTARGIVRAHWETGATSGAPPVQERPAPGGGEADDESRAAYRDRAGTIWVATGGTLEQFRPGKITPIPRSVGTRDAAFAADSSGRLWIGARQSDAPSTYDGRLTPLPTMGGSVTAVATGPDGTVWMVGYGGLYRHMSGTWSRVPFSPKLEDPSAVTTPFNGLAVTSDGALWMSSKGVWRLKDGIWMGPDDLRGLPTVAAFPTSLYAQGNTVWVGYTGNRIASVEEPGLAVRTYATADGLAVGDVLALANSADGLWVAGDAALQHLHSGRFSQLSGVGGEHFANITGIVERENGEVWLNGVHGLFRIDAADMAAWRRNPGRPVPFELMNERDGRPGAPSTYHVNSLVAGKDGRLWIGSDRGIAFIDADRVVRNRLAPVITIDAINGQSPTAGSLALGQGMHRADIAFTAPVLGVPERARFRYRLAGTETATWTTTTERRATFTNLAPGDYRFEVQAANEDGVWSTSIAQVRFSIAPEFYQTWWFRGLCILAALALVYAGYLMRIRHLGILICARLLERERIARDFHDTILQSLHAALLRTKMATDAITDEDARDKLEKAMEATRDALVEGREKITALRGDRQSPSLLPERIEKLAGLLGSGSSARFSLDIVGEARSVNPAAEDDIHAVVSEMLSNAFQHAEATSVSVTVVFKKRSLSVSVRDDGVGMDVKQVSRRAQRPGWGLIGMQERAQRLASKFTIRSTPGGGTTVTLSVPGPIAYWLPPGTVARLRGRRWALWSFVAPG
ncbi:signal transduction histidine kinase [Luteibacter jiangsuensis]|uniref:Signal transduction histidine kinase n=1 Tax=Luteibacter jiangsuensis TaxID=637577 RepID=A0ABT9STI7_9GAMM|nr:sensor histidine kinase [Luteibacter jiangsuensis]MDQ0008291.1 signal transduction histidine kinase [Luteibacter jiangsuensis]